MRYKYYYCVLHNPQLTSFLEANQIRYRLSGGGIVPTFVIFSLYSSSSNTQFLVKGLGDLCSRDPIITPEFSKRELENSKLLLLRPKKQIIEITNGKYAFDYACKWIDSFGFTRVGHEWQIDTLAIAKEPSMNTRTALWASDTGFSEIYADRRVCELATESCLSGVEFRNVLVKDGTYSKNLFQMTSNNLIQRDKIARGYGEKIEKCPICGKEQFCIDSSYQLHLIDSDDITGSDFSVTERIFGEGIAEPMYIISQRFYRLLKQNNLTGNVVFTPVVCIS